MAQLDRDSEVPVGTQLAWRLRARMLSGELRAGDRLPAVREMATQAGVNVNTVRAVYARLASQGLISSEHGRGTFVTGAPRRDLAELVARAAREASERGLDPRDLAAALYAGGSVALGGDEVRARHALRGEIEALEQQLAELEPFGREPSGSAVGGVGARLMTAEELEAVRDGLSRRVAERRREARRERAAKPREAATESAGAWPELLALRPGRLAPS
jgi:DNA-binding transcriptional regulator YhcF (GntR family)